MKTVIITGASSGLGKAIKDQMELEWNEADAAYQSHAGEQPEELKIYDWSLTNDVDVRDQKSLQQAVKKLAFPVDILINCAGINHIEFIPQLEEWDWNRIMDTNAKGIFLVVKTLLNDHQLKGGTILNIVSNASHMPMTSSLAYNASKGAAEIMTKQMSRELIKTHGITVFGISPNKLKNTGMSAYIDQKVQELRGWTKEEAQKYQLASLPAGEETDPETLAEFICFLLSSKERHRFLAGCILQYGL